MISTPYTPAPFDRVRLPLSWALAPGNGAVSVPSAGVRRVEFSTGTADQIAPGSNHPRHWADLDLPDTVLRVVAIAKIALGPGDTDHRLAVALGESSNARGAVALVRQDTPSGALALELGVWTPSGYTALTTPGGVGAYPATTTWIRLSQVGARVALAVGEGVTEPREWSLIGHGLSQSLPERITGYLIRWGVANDRAAELSRLAVEVAL